MEAGGKDTEEETLQTAFKKLRVDAESVPVAASVSETLAPGGAKPKLSCPKDNWHGCTRKTSRGASRTQRRRRSKSPILHPPKFTYCSTSAAAALSPPGVCLKHQRLAVPEPVEPHPAADGTPGSSVVAPAQKELSSSGTAGHISPVVFGSAAGYDVHVRPENASASPSPGGESSGDGISSEENAPEKGVCDRTDFRALSKLHSSGAAEGPRIPCSCSEPVERHDEGTRAAECPCRSRLQGWNGVEVYSFTGLRHVISECESGLPSHGDATRTVAATSAAAPASTALTSGSPRSCSEQARAYVDDITIEDLSGYMEYYLYIPKKMSHMAEMMYT